MIAESDVTMDPRLRRLGARLLRQGALYDRLARAPRSEETIHRLRVLTRRMRAACTLARRIAPAPALRDLARGLRKTGRALGERRALDVAAADYAFLSGGKTHPLIERARIVAETKLLRRLRPRDREAVVAATRGAARAMGSAEAEPGALERFLRRRKERLRNASGAVTKEELHVLRIEAKKTRYALEAARVMTGGRAAPAERTLKRLQRQLGRIHDLEVLRALLPARDPVAVRAAAQEASLRNGVRPLANALNSVALVPRGRNGRTP
ncbi:MAG TPA: CHAD domain-containing protein [Planctomycetota bacterium]|jgi:hypothetical protein